jgi:hypothetical protein
MSLTLLSPWALIAAGLLAIPVIIHLFKPRRVRQTPFSSLRWLNLSPQKLSRRIQWHQVLLFLLRAAWIILLVLALSRPLLTAGGESGVRERFLVLDVSHSMNYRASGQAPPIERAKVIAADLVRRHQPGDRTAILLTGSQTHLLTTLSREPENYLPALADVQAGLTDTDLGSALPVIRGMLGRPREGASAEIWFITDNQQHAWRQGVPAIFLDGLSMPVKVHVVDAGVAGAQNAWITRARLLEFSKPARRVLRVELGCVGDEAQERKLHLDAISTMPARVQDVTLTPGRTTALDFEVPASANLESGLVRFHLELSDGLPADDEYLLNLDTQGSVRVLLVENPATATESSPSGHHLQTALKALSETAGQLLRLTTISAIEAKASDFRTADVVLLADVPELSDEAMTALEERVRGGAGVAIFLGAAGKPAWLNDRLYKRLDPANGLLPARVRPAALDENRLAPLTSVQWSHPLLAGLDDTKVGDLAQMRFRSWYEFAGDFDEHARVLARIDEGAPALIERTLGAGRIVILNTGANDRWSDLPRRKSYVPLIDRLMSHLSASGSRRNFAVGEVVTLPLSGWEKGETLTIATPEGRRLTPAIRLGEGGRATATFEATEAGVYRIERGSTSISVVAQANRGDSVLSPMDTALLQQWWEPAGCEVIRGDALTQHLEAEGDRHAIWPWLLLLAGLVLLAETYLVHRLCPQANPKLAQNLVAPRGLSRPSTTNG